MILMTRTENQILTTSLRLLLGIALCAGALIGWRPAQSAPAAPVTLSPGQLDTGFDPGSGADDIVYAVTIQPDGKVLIGGRFENVDGMARSGIARLNADGELDTYFSGSTGGVMHSVLAITAQLDGSVIIGGAFTSYGGTPQNRIARLNEYGGLDTSFDPGDGPNTVVEAIAVQPDGKIIIGGGFTTYDGAAAPYIARLNADGSLDTSFDTGSGPNSTVEALALQPDGKIIIGGSFVEVNGLTKNRIARLNPDGSLDTTFYGSAPAVVRTIALQADGYIIIGGDFSDSVYRLNASGNRDTSFDTGTGADAPVWAVAVQPDGKVIAGGDFTHFDSESRPHVVRLDTDGSVDPTFTSTPTYDYGTDDSILALALQVDGKVLLGGTFSLCNGAARSRIARMHADGHLDDGLDVGTGAYGSVNQVAAAADGKVWVAGAFTQFAGLTRNRVVRLHANGTLDANFHPGTGPNDVVRALVPQPDGKVLIGGVFTVVQTVDRGHIARLNDDGSLDTSFDPGDGADNVVTDLVLQQDGKVLIAGWFDTVDSESRNGIARLHADGSLDTGFDPGTGANDDVYALALQSDGKVLIAGKFTQVNGVDRKYVARLNADGSLDTSFDPGVGPDQFLTTVASQPDGKVLIGGYLTLVGDTARNGIARLNADGSLDTSFDPGDGVSGGVILDILVQEDGKVLTAGGFTIFGGATRRRIARLEANGDLDTGFFPGSGADNTVRSVAFQPGAKVLIGGDFSIYGGVSAEGVARLNGAENPSTVSIYPPDGKVGIPYSFTFTATGFPLPTFHVTSGNLPPGLTLDMHSGELSGTPTTVGSYTFGIVVCNFIAPCGDATTSMDITEPDEFDLSVNLTGDGSGVVSSDPVGINCPGVCTMTFTEGTTVTLTAASDIDSTFVGWSGDCSGTGTTCQVMMGAARIVTATFDLVPAPTEVYVHLPLITR